MPGPQALLLPPPLPQPAVARAEHSSPSPRSSASASLSPSPRATLRQSSSASTPPSTCKGSRTPASTATSPAPPRRSTRTPAPSSQKSRSTIRPASYSPACTRSSPSTRSRVAGSILIPSDAIAIRKDKSVSSPVLTSDNKVHMQPVEIGRDYGPSTEIVIRPQRGRHHHHRDHRRCRRRRAGEAKIRRRPRRKSRCQGQHQPTGPSRRSQPIRQPVHHRPEHAESASQIAAKGRR